MKDFIQKNVKLYCSPDTASRKVVSLLKRKFIEKYNKHDTTIKKDIRDIFFEIFEDIPDPENGIIAEIHYDEFKEIWYKEPYVDVQDDKIHHHYIPVRYFFKKTISTKKQTIEDDQGRFSAETIEGMTKEELMQYFPERTGSSSYGFDQQFIIRSIIYEEFQNVGINRDKGNIRHLWYTNMKTVLVGKLGLDEIKLVSPINSAWDSVINSGLVTYEGLNILGGKESGRLSANKDSPFYNILIGVEKLAYFEIFKWIPELFHTTLVTGGGQFSRAVTRAFVYELTLLGYDLDSDFHICMISDLDPSGYYIQNALKNQLLLAIDYYGGKGNVHIHRLFVTPEQVTPDLLKSEVIPWVNKSEDQKTKKTRWEYFCSQTRTPENPEGGLYLEDGREGILEMDVFDSGTIEKKILEELIQIIRTTTDESKIMIPEIMRIFDEIKGDVSEQFFKYWKQRLIETLKRDYISDIEQWKEDIECAHDTSKKEIKDEYKAKYDALEEKRKERFTDEYEEKEELDNTLTALKKTLKEEIQKLKDKYEEDKKEPSERLEELQDIIDKGCVDIDDKEAELEDKEEEEKKNADKIYNHRMEKYEEFKEEQLSVFNPIEERLKQDIIEQVNEHTDIRYQTLEKDDEFRKSLASVVVEEVDNLLHDDDFSTFDSDIIPTFKGENFLEKAANDKQLNISRYRASFSKAFIKAMKHIITSKADKLRFTIDDAPEKQDLTDELKKAKKQCEKEVHEMEAQDD